MQDPVSIWFGRHRARTLAAHCVRQLVLVGIALGVSGCYFLAGPSKTPDWSGRAHAVSADTLGGYTGYYRNAPHSEEGALEPDLDPSLYELLAMVRGGDRDLEVFRSTAETVDRDCVHLHFTDAETAYVTLYRDGRKVASQRLDGELRPTNVFEMDKQHRAKGSVPIFWTYGYQYSWLAWTEDGALLAALDTGGMGLFVLFPLAAADYHSRGRYQRISPLDVPCLP